MPAERNTKRPEERRTCNVFLDGGDRVPGWVARNKDRTSNGTILLVNHVDNIRHLVELLRADVGAVCKAKVKEAPAAAEVLLGKFLSILVEQLEWAADQRLARLDGLGMLLTWRSPSEKTWRADEHQSQGSSQADDDDRKQPL